MVVLPQMKDFGPRYDFHAHTIFSDGMLLPAALAREAEVRGHAAIAITDHVDASNLEYVIAGLSKFAKEQGPTLGIKVIPGVELSYLAPELIEKYAQKARKLGARLIVVHGESPVEPVIPGTNDAAVKLKGLVDILAHPGGGLTEEQAREAKVNDIFLEISGRKGHKDGNQRVVELARKAGAKLLLNTDAHSDKDLLTQQQALELALEAGLTQEEALKILKDNPLEILRQI